MEPKYGLCNGVFGSLQTIIVPRTNPKMAYKASQYRRSDWIQKHMLLSEGKKQIDSSTLASDLAFFLRFRMSSSRLRAFLEKQLAPFLWFAVEALTPVGECSTRATDFNS